MCKLIPLREMCCFKVTISCMHHLLPMVTLYCLFKVISKPETNKELGLNWWEMWFISIFYTFLQVSLNGSTWQWCWTDNFLCKSLIVGARIINFPSIDNIKFILFQSQIQIFISEFHAKSATIYYMQMLVYAYILIIK